MSQGSLLLLTILTLVQVWGGSWPPGGEGCVEDGNMMRNFGLPESRIPNQNTQSLILNEAILSTLRSPSELTNPTLDKRDSNRETITLDAAMVRLQSLLRALKTATKLNSQTRNRERNGRIRIL